MALTWRSRNAVPTIKSTARLVTTRNGTHAVNSPIWNIKDISPNDFIHLIDASMRGGI